MYQEALTAFRRNLWLLAPLSLASTLAYLPAILDQYAGLVGAYLVVLVPLVALVVAIWQGHRSLATPDGRAPTGLSRVHLPPNRFWMAWLTVFALPAIAAWFIGVILLRALPAGLVGPSLGGLTADTVLFAVLYLVWLGALLPLVGLVFPLIAEGRPGGFRTALALSRGRRGRIFARLMAGPLVAVVAVTGLYLLIGAALDPLVFGLLSGREPVGVALFVLYDAAIGLLTFVPGFVLAAALAGPYRSARLVSGGRAG